MSEFSFLSGYKQIKRKDVTQVKEEIMRALSITARTNWYFRLYGKVEPKVSEVRLSKPC
jgi:hypothetical protein